MIAADNKILTQTAMAEAARPLPAWTYSNAELQPLEYQRLILESWQIVCHVNQVKQPGDYATLDLLSDSIFVMRGDDGEVRAFQNVCRHRGARLLDGAGTCARRLVCPYHGWTYDNTGRLAAVPAEGTFPGIDRSRLGLRQVRHEVFMGFVFVRVVGDGPGVAEMWGDFARHLEPYGFERMEPLSKLWTAVWNADWKVAVDNNLENYHIPLGHPGYQRMLRNQLESEINPHGVARSVSVPARDVYGLRVARSEHGYASLGVGSPNVTRAQHCRAEFFAAGYGWVPVDPADVRKVVLEEPPGKLAVNDPRVEAARKRLFGSWEMNYLAYNMGHDVKLPNSSGPKLPYLMYINAETGGEMRDQLDPDSLMYSITSREVKA